MLLEFRVCCLWVLGWTLLFGLSLLICCFDYTTLVVDWLFGCNAVGCKVVFHSWYFGCCLMDLCYCLVLVGILVFSCFNCA